MACGHPALLHGCRGEARKTDDVAGGVDIRHHRGLERVRVDLDAAAGIGLDADGLKPETADIAAAAGGVEHHFGADAAAIRKRHLGEILSRLHLLDAAAQPDGHAAVAHLVDEVVDDLAVDEIENRVARLDQRHRHVERRKDGGVFDADDAGADHRQRTRQLRQFEHLVAVEHTLLVERHLGRAMRPRAHRDQGIGEADLAVVAGIGGEAGAIGTEKPHHGARALDRIAHELVLQHLDLVVEGLVQAFDQVADGDVLLDPVTATVEAAFAPARQVEHRLAQGLGGDGAGMHRNPAQAPAGIGHQHTLAELGRLHGGAPTRRAAADDQHVVVHKTLLSRRGSRRASYPVAAPPDHIKLALWPSSIQPI